MIDLNRIQLTDSQMFQECDKDWGEGAKTAPSEESKGGKTAGKNVKGSEGKITEMDNGGKNAFNLKTYSCE